VFLVPRRSGARSRSNNVGRRKPLLQPFVIVGVGYERSDDIKESQEVGCVHVI